VRPESEDWQVMRELEARLKSGRMKLTAKELATMRRAAGQVCLQEHEVRQALAIESGQAELIVEIRRRIREGSQRLMRAFTQSQQLLDQGDATRAREVLQSALEQEQIPFYRETIEAEMRNLGLAT